MSGHLGKLAVVTCVFALAFAAGPAQAGPTPIEKRLVKHINTARAAHGLRPLKVGTRLNAGARSWSRHLVRRDSFHHASDLRPGTGEIIAWGTCNWFNPRQAVRMWLGSPGHRALMLRPGFRFVGTGWTRGAWRSYGCVKMAVARFR
ncbi:MAG TPA: CAP domain-containing protein [Gaiellaceae bacterium]|nr:CAP domain-containing protein [Gaiellaceae bacterium]